MVIKKFEEVIAWQKAQDLAVAVYHAFEGAKDFSFNNQIQRAVTSISNNIAEGFDRSSDADFVRFLYYAISSCSEVKSMLHLATRLNYLSEERRNELLDQCDEVSKLLRGFIKYLNAPKHR